MFNMFRKRRPRVPSDNFSIVVESAAETYAMKPESAALDSVERGEVDSCPRAYGEASEVREAMVVPPPPIMI